MSKFYTRKRKMDVYSEAILRTINNANRYLTPSQIADYLGIHPTTAKSRILKLRAKGLIECRREGSKIFCRSK